MNDADLQRFELERALAADRERRKQTKGRDIGDRGETSTRALADLRTLRESPMPVASTRERLLSPAIAVLEADARRETSTRALEAWAPQLDELEAANVERAALRQVLRSIVAHWNAASSPRHRDHLVLLAGRLVDVDRPGPRMFVDGGAASVVDAVPR